MMDVLRGLYCRVAAPLVRAGAANDARRAFRAAAQALPAQGRAALAALRDGVIADLGPKLPKRLDPAWLDPRPNRLPRAGGGFDMAAFRGLMSRAQGGRGGPYTPKAFAALRLRDLPRPRTYLDRTIADATGRADAIGADLRARLDAHHAAALDRLRADAGGPPEGRVEKLAAAAARALIDRTRQRVARQIADDGRRTRAAIRRQLTLAARKRFQAIQEKISEHYLVPYWHKYRLEHRLGRELNRLGSGHAAPIPLADIRDSDQWPEVFARLVTDNLELVIARDGRKLVRAQQEPLP